MAFSPAGTPRSYAAALEERSDILPRHRRTGNGSSLRVLGQSPSEFLWARGRDCGGGGLWPSPKGTPRETDPLPSLRGLRVVGVDGVQEGLQGDAPLSDCWLRSGRGRAGRPAENARGRPEDQAADRRVRQSCPARRLT